MTDQIKLLNNLAKKIKAERNSRTKAQALETLVSAGILTKSGSFSANYPNLGKVVTKSR